MAVDKDLATALKRAKTTPMFFALVVKGGSSGALVVTKEKPPAGAIADAKQKSGGTAVIKGRCFGEDDKLVFETPKVPAPNWEKIVKQLAKDEAGLMIHPEFRLGADPDALPEETAKPEDLKALWTKEFDAINRAVADVVNRAFLGFEQVKAEFRRAQGLAGETKYLEAVGLLATVGELIERCKSGAPVTPPDPMPSAEELEWTARLAAVSADLKEALTIGTPQEAGALKARFSEAQLAAKQKAFQQALVALDLVAQLAQEVFDSHGSPGPILPNEDAATTWKRLLAVVSPIMVRVFNTGGPNVESIKQQFRGAQALAAKPDFATALPELRKAKSMALKALVAMQAAGAEVHDGAVGGGNDAETWKQRVKKMTPDLTQALKQGLGDTSKIRSVFAYAQEKATAADFSSALKGLDSLDVLLAAALRGGAPTAAPTSAESKEKRKAQAAKFQRSMDLAPQRTTSEDAYLEARTALLSWATRAEPSEYDPLLKQLAEVAKLIDAQKYSEADAGSAKVLEAAGQLKKTVETREAALAKKLKTETLANLKIQAAALIEKWALVLKKSVPALVADAVGFQKHVVAKVKPSENPDPSAAREAIDKLEQEYERIAETNLAIDEQRKRLSQLEIRYTTAAKTANKKDRRWTDVDSARGDLKGAIANRNADAWADPYTLEGTIDDFERTLNAYEGKAADTEKRAALKQAKADWKEVSDHYNALKKEATATLKGAIEPIGDQIVELLKDKELLEEDQVAEFDDKLEEYKTQLQLIIQRKAQRKSTAEAFEQSDGGHSLGRHGPEVSKKQLQDRVTTGFAPDGVFSPFKTSSQFGSYEEWNATRESAVQDAKARGHDFGTDMKKAPPPGGLREVIVIVNHGRAVGSGVKGRGTGYLTTTTSGKTGRVYTEFDELPELKKTTTTFKWTGTKWIAAQHFPSE